MKTIDLHQVDAFTDKIFGGNPAGVVTNADGLTDKEMAHVAREMNLSETAFVLAPTSIKADVKLRYFTPSAELDFCGHATIGTLYELSRLGKYGLSKNGRNDIRVETGAGVLSMSVTCQKDAEPRITFVAPPVEMEAYRSQGQVFADAFGISTNALLPKGEILIDRKLTYLYIPIASLEQLGALQFDFERIRTHFASDNIIAFCLFTSDTFDKKSDLHARITCPLIGIDEDPFTGSIQSGLVHAAKQLGLIDSKQSAIRTEQGNFLGRPGFADVMHDISAETVSITASAAQVFSTTMEL
jgi:PhzF family phenazine biosynthesis protein